MSPALLMMMLACGGSNKFGLSDGGGGDTAETDNPDRGANDVGTGPSADDTDDTTGGPSGPGSSDDTGTSAPDDTETTGGPGSGGDDTGTTGGPSGPGDDGGTGGPGTGSDDTGFDCDDTPGPPHSGSSCVTETIACGETVAISTRGGTDVLESSFYESATCFIPYSDYDGPERVYELILDGGGAPMTATVTLDSPCEDLSLATFFWTEDECPEGTAHNINSCDGGGASSGDSATLYTTGEDPDRYLIAVDGDEEAAFMLSVSCSG